MPGMSLSDDSDEELGLLGGTLRKAQARQQRYAVRGPEHGGGTSLLARVLAAWRKPLHSGMFTLGCLKRRCVGVVEEEECLEQLRTLASIAFDREDMVHEHTLRRLFSAVRGPAEARSLPPGVKDPRWKEMGFQSEDPRTDFRGGGLLALQNLCYLAEAYPEDTGWMLKEAIRSGRAEYLFAAASISITAMLVLLLGLNRQRGISPVRGMPCPANVMARKNFARVLYASVSRPGTAGNTAAEVFGELFAAGVRKLHSEWRDLCRRKPTATLLDFGEALAATAIAMERLLDSLGPSDQSCQKLFGQIEKIDPRHWSTKLKNMLCRWQSAILEVLCRFLAALSELISTCRPPKRRRILDL